MANTTTTPTCVIETIQGKAFVRADDIGIVEVVPTIKPMVEHDDPDERPDQYFSCKVTLRNGEFLYSPPDWYNCCVVRQERIVRWAADNGVTIL